MSVLTTSNPEGVPKPASRYSQAVIVENASRRLIISGQVGVARDGTLSRTPEGQVMQAFDNLHAILTAHGMGWGDVVKVSAFLTDRALTPAFRAARDTLFAEHAPASTLLIVAGLADPAWVVEIEAEAVA